MTYGRSRLVLGVTGVGFWVTLSTVLLLADVPARLSAWAGTGLISNALVLVGFVAGYVVLHAVLDVFGGYVLPKRPGRLAAPWFAGWLRGVVTHGSIMLAVAVAMLIASRGPGVPGMVLVGIAAGIVMLRFRTALGRAIGDHSKPEPSPELGEDVAVVSSGDVGYTGGIDGLTSARRQLVPARWVRELSGDELSLALDRRRAAVSSGLWQRGRMLAGLFTGAGLGVAAGQVGELVGTAGGVIAFSLVFTLWSFAGLLVLPTVTRRASHQIDAALIGRGVEPSRLRDLASKLDAMQDAEPSRPGWIESIFHPIPNVDARTSVPTRSRLAGYDTARTSAFLSLAGLGLLGRAVHCNSGRPALWVYYPLD